MMTNKYFVVAFVVWLLGAGIPDDYHCCCVILEFFSENLNNIIIMMIAKINEKQKIKTSFFVMDHRSWHMMHDFCMKNEEQTLQTKGTLQLFRSVITYADRNQHHIIVFCSTMSWIQVCICI